MVKLNRTIGIILTIIGLLSGVFFYYYVHSVTATAVSLFALMLGLTGIFIFFSPGLNHPFQKERLQYIPFISIAFSLAIINIILIIFNQTDMAIYFVADSIIFILNTLYFSTRNYKTVGALNKMSAIIFIGFLAVIALKINDMLK